MSTKAIEKESILMEMHQIVSMERLTFLSSFLPQDLVNGSLLDLHHQTILRISYQQSNGEVDNKFLEYCCKPDSRWGILSELKQKLRETISKEQYHSLNLNHKTESKINTKGGFSYFIRNEKMIAQFGALASAVKEESDFTFADSNGFAYYTGLTQQRAPYYDFQVCPSNQFASTGAMMFYANTHGNEVYFLKQSIEVLAETLFIIANNSERWKDQKFSNENKFFGNEMTHYLSQFTKQVDSKQIYNDCVGFLTWHEFGHLCQPSDGDIWIFNFLDRLNIDHSNLYHPSSPYQDMLGSWKKIKEGEGGVREVLFLLGDFIANTNILSFIPYPEQVLMRIFHWWMLKKPSLKRRPRGFGAFLFCAITNDFDSIDKDFGFVLKTAQEHPAKLAQALLDFESKYWNYLTQNEFDDLIGAQV